jgi:hypothetical protein
MKLTPSFNLGLHSTVALAREKYVTYLNIVERYLLYLPLLLLVLDVTRATKSSYGCIGIMTARGKAALMSD